MEWNGIYTGAVMPQDAISLEDFYSGTEAGVPKEGQPSGQASDLSGPGWLRLGSAPYASFETQNKIMKEQVGAIPGHVYGAMERLVKHGSTDPGDVYTALSVMGSGFGAARGGLGVFGSKPKGVPVAQPSDWPLIKAGYEQGKSIAQLARDFPGWHRNTIRANLEAQGVEFKGKRVLYSSAQKEARNAVDREKRAESQTQNERIAAQMLSDPSIENMIIEAHRLGESAGMIHNMLSRVFNLEKGINNPIGLANVREKIYELKNKGKLRAGGAPVPMSLDEQAASMSEMEVP